MRRKKIKPLISFIPKNRKLIDKATQIMDFLSKVNEAKNPEYSARLKVELETVTIKLKVPKVTEQIIYDFDDQWNKLKIAPKTVFVRKTDELYVATEDGSTWDIIDFEEDYPAVNGENVKIVLTPDKKHSQVYWRNTFFNIASTCVCEHDEMNKFLNSIDPEQGDGLMAG